jgi:uridine kinase
VSKPLIIGVAGGSGSGKSTVAKNVADALGSLSVAFIDMDAYYRNFVDLPIEERRRVNWDHPTLSTTTCSPNTSHSSQHESRSPSPSTISSHT